MGFGSQILGLLLSREDYMVDLLLFAPYRRLRAPKLGYKIVPPPRVLVVSNSYNI